jgi:hypothetical protein
MSQGFINALTLTLPVGVTSGGTGLTSTTINQLLYSSGTSTIAGLATANSGVLVTSAGGVPSISSTLPSGIAATNMALTTPTLGAASATSLSFSSTSGIIGTTTNNNAAAGSVGEYVNSGIIGSTNFTTTATYQNITSISLTAGDWSVSFSGLMQVNITPTSVLIIGLSTVSATSPPGGGVGVGECYFNVLAAPASSVFTFNGTEKRFSLSGTTTIYLCGATSWTGGAPAFYCQLTARRVR